jgi:FMN-dependent NADH-azoreductase
MSTVLYIKASPRLDRSHSLAVVFDFQTTYLEFILGFMGITDIRRVIVEPTLEGGPEVAQTRRQAAIVQAHDMAKKILT